MAYSTPGVTYLDVPFFLSFKSLRRVCWKRCGAAGETTLSPNQLSVAEMNQEGAGGPATAPVHSMTLGPAKDPAAEAAAAWPSAACSGGVGTHSGGSGPAADPTPGKSGGPTQSPASPSNATTAAVSKDVTAAAAAAVAAAATATVLCAAAASAATVAAAVITAGSGDTAGAGRHDDASVTLAPGGASGGGGGVASVPGAAEENAAAGATLTSGGSSNIGGSAVSGATRAAGQGDQAPAGKPRRSLSAWLKEGPFVLSMSPGFFGFYAHIGALIALEAEGLLEGVSFATGASAGGLVAGLFAAGLSPADMGETVVKFRRSDFWDPVGFGGLLRGKKFEEIVKATLPPGVSCFDQCRVPLAVSAFDAFHLTTRSLERGCLAQALRATCTFPVLFAPVWHEKGVLVDGGVRDTTGMWCVPERRKDCRRVLNVTFGDKDGRGVCVPPSSFPTASNPRPTADDMEIVSLPLTGLPRPHPFAMERGADAMEAARSQVAAAVGLPLLAGRDDSHWIAATSFTQPPPTCEYHDDVNTCHGGVGASTAVSHSGVVGKRTTASGSTTSGNSDQDGAGSAASGTVALTPSTTHAAPAFRNTATAAGGRTAVETSTRTAVDIASRAAAAAYPAGNKGGRGPGKGSQAASVATAVTVPVKGAAVAVTEAASPTNHHHQQSAPPAPGAAGAQIGKKRRRVSAAERLRGFNRKGIAEDGSGDERRSGKRRPGRGGRRRPARAHVEKSAAAQSPMDGLDQS